MKDTKSPLTWPNGQSKEVITSVNFSELQLTALVMAEVLQHIGGASREDINLHTTFNPDKSITVHVCKHNHEAAVDFSSVLERMKVMDEEHQLKEAKKYLRLLP